MKPDIYFRFIKSHDRVIFRVNKINLNGCPPLQFQPLIIVFKSKQILIAIAVQFKHSDIKYDQKQMRYNFIILMIDIMMPLCANNKSDFQIANICHTNVNIQKYSVDSFGLFSHI